MSRDTKSSRQTGLDLDCSFTGYRERLRTSWKAYLAQSLLVALVAAILLLILTFEHIVVVVSLGSMAFIIFARPHSDMAQARHVIGGQALGLLAGGLFGFVPQEPLIIAILAHALAVGLAALLMVAFEVEHSPAAGTALGVALQGISLKLALAVLGSAVVLSLAHWALRHRLKDL